MLLLLSPLSCPTLCDPIDSSPPSSPIPGILQARILERVAISFSNFLHTAAADAAKSLQSCPTLCDPRDGSPPGSAVPGILQARTLEWVAIFFSIHNTATYYIIHMIIKQLNIMLYDHRICPRVHDLSIFSTEF